MVAIIRGMLQELRPGAPAQAIGLDARIDRDLGFDSLSRVELVMRIERDFGVRLPEHLAAAARTPRDLVNAIARADRSSRRPLPSRPAPPPPPVVGAPVEASTLPEAMRWHLERHPEREHIRIIEGEDTLATMSYAELWAAANDVAHGLAASGIGRDDAVAIMLPTGSAFFHAFLGAMLAGAVPVPLYPPLRWTEIEEHVHGRAAILANCAARMLITVPEAMFVARIARATLPELRAAVSVERLRVVGARSATVARRNADIAMLQYTSGSTGDPKGVMLSHRHLLANLRAMGAAAGITSSDRFVSWLPLYHDMGLIGAWLGSLYLAMPLVLMSPASFLARPARWLHAIHRYGATISAGPNFAYEIAAAKLSDEDLEGLDLRAWRIAFNGAEPVRAATLERFAARFAPYGFDRRALTPVYGLAESAVGLTFPPLARGPRIDRIDAHTLEREGRAVAPANACSLALDVVSCGLPLAGYALRVVDERERELPERSEGRVEFRGPSATPGYYRNPSATARLFRDGWLDTGDVGYVAGGELFLTSRAKDLIKRGGHNIHPYDLEAALGDIPGIRKGCVAVFGTTDHASGTERVVVVAETNESDMATRAALRERIMALADIHLNGPADEVLLVPARTVLKTSSGKIRRAACRELYERGLLEAPRHAVWVQLARLGIAAFASRLRRGFATIVRVAYGLHAWTMLALVALAGLPLLALPAPARFRAGLARLAARVLRRTCGIALAIEGSERLPAGGPAVIVANHASYIDALVLLAALPRDLHFAAKREFSLSPVTGFALRRLGTYFVERVDPAQGLEDTRDLAAALARGETLAVFAEGTFSRAPGLGPFRLGAFAVSASAAVPVVPVVLRGTRSVLREGHWLPARGPITVSIQAPMRADGSDWAAAVRLRDRVRDVVLRHCGEPDLATPTTPAP